MIKNKHFFHLDLIERKKMFILSDLYRVAIGVGDRVLTPGMKKVF